MLMPYSILQHGVGRDSIHGARRRFEASVSRTDAEQRGKAPLALHNTEDAILALFFITPLPPYSSLHDFVSPFDEANCWPVLFKERTWTTTTSWWLESLTTKQFHLYLTKL
jgi:hypothetical protein